MKKSKRVNTINKPKTIDMNPIIIYSDKFLNAISLGSRVNGISLFPFIILREFKGEPISFRKKLEFNEKLIRHEAIHFKQADEVLRHFDKHHQSLINRFNNDDLEVLLKH